MDVLLATYNGDKYIESFLLSLMKQTNCKINLYVSDDGSEDLTIPLVLKYQNEFNDFHLMRGPEMGPMANFFNLMNASKGKYVALADQDDIWMENHLYDSVQRISNLNSPSLTFSSVAQFTCCLLHFKIWPDQKTQLDFPNYFFENIGRGCTFVMNSSARDLVNQYSPNCAIMHDWWILLRLLLQGNVIFSSCPEIFYRIHDANHIGIGSPGLTTTLRTLWLGRIGTIQQLNELAKVVLEDENSFHQFKLRNLVRKVNGGLIDRVKLAVSFNHRYRYRFMDDCKLRIVLVLLPFFNRNS